VHWLGVLVAQDELHTPRLWLHGLEFDDVATRWAVEVQWLPVLPGQPTCLVRCLHHCAVAFLIPHAEVLAHDVLAGTVLERSVTQQLEHGRVADVEGTHLLLRELVQVIDLPL
jgi:hypothetical protein